MSDDEKIINSIKGLGIDMISTAKSGHPGIVLSAAPILYTLYSKHINISLDDFNWNNRDRFVMSAGHGSALLYSMLYFVGYLSLDNLKKFRSINSVTPGHPEKDLTPGVDISTGPLGQGIASAVGMSIASKYLKEKYGEDLYNYNTYVLCGDGDLMEGVSYEATSLAGTLKLDNLIVLYDSNGVSLDGVTDNAFSDKIRMRFESIGWYYIKVEDGTSIDDIDNAIKLAKESNGKPTIIEVKTIIGNGSLKEGTNLVHGAPLSEEDIIQLKEKLNLSSKPFSYDKSLLKVFQRDVRNRCDEKYKKWCSISKEKNIDFNINLDINALIEPYDKNVNEPLREINGKIMNAIANNVDMFLGGAADLSSSTKTILFGKGIFSKENYLGRNILYGVREHAMASISNGLASCGIRPFASTFLAFSDYMKPAIRMSALMNLPVTYVFTHDSINIGSDGPTHQPIEQLSMLRSIPNFRVFRPADINEIIGSWNEIMNNPKPTALILSRNASPTIENTSYEKVSNGAYIVYKEKSRLDAIIIATGTEVNVAVEIARILEKEKIHLRVVSMPCMSLFENMSEEYKEDVLPAGYKKIVIEFGSSCCWYKYVYGEKYLVNVNSFGKSGSKEQILSDFKLDIDSIKNHIKKILK